MDDTSSQRRVAGIVAAACALLGLGAALVTGNAIAGATDDAKAATDGHSSQLSANDLFSYGG